MRTSSLTRRFAFALGFGAGFASLAGAQTTLYDWYGDQQYDRLGSSVACAGDFNNDGHPDVVAGARQDFMPFFEGEGYARIYDGLTGTIIATYTGDVVTDAFGGSVDGAGDVNNDGWDDVVIGAPFSSFNSTSMRGMVRVVSGQTGAILYTLHGAASGDQLGAVVSAAGDVNADGFDDFIGGAPDANSNWGMARVFSGADGSILHQFDGTGSNKRLGASVSDLGDVNGDGKADVIIGSLFEGVFVYSGANGAQIHHFTAASADVYGRSVSSIADMNGDGRRDILIGATQEDVFSPDVGYVEVRSGANGTLLLTITGTTVNHRFGWKVDDAGDWNGDGKPDIIVGSDPVSSADAYATIHSGVDGSVLATFVGDVPGDDMGYSVAGLGDVNGDGKIDVACGAHLAQVNGLASGQVRVYSSSVTSCGSVVSYCISEANSSGNAATITGTGSTSVATNAFVLVASGCPLSQWGLWYYGRQRLQITFGNGWRCVGGQIFRLGTTKTNTSGTASKLIDLTSLPPGGDIVAGDVIDFQYWFRDPDGLGDEFDLTDGVEVTFCP